MILKDYFEVNEDVEFSKNYVIEIENLNFLLTHNLSEEKYYLNGLDYEFYNLDIDKFIKFVESDIMEISYDLYLKLCDNYKLIPFKNFYIRQGFFSPVVVIDNSDCELAVEEFNSITLAMLWLYRGYYTSGHNDLYLD